MHTFFINTSGKELDNYSDIFEIQHETRKLVSIDCPITDWCETDEGYKNCVQRMGELIDSYKDINNNYNLIVYIDLLSYDKYTSISLDKHRERYACLKALRSLLKHFIKETLVSELIECGREPQEVLIIFEENQPPKDGDESTEDGKNLIRFYTKEFLGIPSIDVLDKAIYSVDGEISVVGVSAEHFCDFAAANFNSCLEKSIISTYSDLVDTFLSELKGYETSEQPLKKLLDRIIDCSIDDDTCVYSVSFVTNRRAGVANKQERTRRNLRLCFYILSCINDETVLDKKTSSDKPLVKAFPEIDWENVVAELTAKGLLYQNKYKHTQRISESFSDMELAPPLYAFDNERFALDEYGKRDKTFEVVDVEEEKNDEQEQKDIDEGIVRLGDKKAVVINDVCGRSLFTKEEFAPFDYKGDDFDETVLGSKATAEQYIQEAHKLRRHHLDYLSRLRVHVSDTMSNYAGRSSENDPAVLRKRKVSVSEEDFDDAGRDYKYAKPGRPEETRKLKTVEDISKTAYQSTLIDYMEFCAGRSVAVTDIEEQCNWFITRVCQIKESLRKIKIVAIGLLFAIIALYIPFVVIQWEAITQNVLTVTVALLSIAIPLILLYVIFGIASIIQRKKYRKAWKEFKAKSDEIIADNAMAAEKYDQLLSIYIPSLRWVYEYKLDVEFYAECCKMARAKINHHIQKLHDRVVTIGNIVEDLEADASERGDVASKARGNSNDEIDYNVSFCSGKKNLKFYSIIDNHFLDTAHK